jgi:hypothetical protein
MRPQANLPVLATVRSPVGELVVACSPAHALMDAQLARIGPGMLGLGQNRDTAGDFGGTEWSFFSNLVFGCLDQRGQLLGV